MYTRGLLHNQHFIKFTIWIDDLLQLHFLFHYYYFTLREHSNKKMQKTNKHLATTPLGSSVCICPWRLWSWTGTRGASRCAGLPHGQQRGGSSRWSGQVWACTGSSRTSPAAAAPSWWGHACWGWGSDCTWSPECSAAPVWAHGPPSPRTYLSKDKQVFELKHFICLISITMLNINAWIILLKDIMMQIHHDVFWMKARTLYTFLWC